MSKTALVVAVLMLPSAAFPAAPAHVTDYSGVYDCTGMDHHEGAYTGVVTMQKIAAQSNGPYAAYSFKLEVPGYGAYFGQAVSMNKAIAVHFALTDQKTKDYGTGLATVDTDEKGKIRFQKYYYEPEYKGGNYGTEECVRR